MALSADAAQMATYLAALTHPDTNAIRQAEIALKPILKNSQCVPAMIEVVKSRETRTMPCVTSPSSFSFSASSQWCCRLVATVCKVEADGSADSSQAAAGWPELFQFIAAAAGDTHPEARELAFLLLGEMTETIGIHLKPQFVTLVSLFSAGLSDGDIKVQNASVKALGLLLSYLSDEDDIDTFAPLIPPILTVAEACRARNDEEIVSTTLDVLYDLCFSPSQAVAAHMTTIVKFSQICMADSNLEMGVRDSAALVVATMAESRPKHLGRDVPLLTGLLETIFNLIENSDGSAAGALFESNPAWKEDFEGTEGYDESEDGATTETGMAQGTLDMLACEVPKKFIFEPVVSRCMSRLGSTDPKQRKAGIACLGVIAEGCAEPLRENLAQVMPHVFKAAGDSDARVRECACFALGQISEHCQPEVLSYSSQILPIVFALLDDANIAVQATSCYVLEMFCERLEPDGVRPLLDPLVKKLASICAAEEEFAPYVPGVANLMAKLMQLKDEKTFLYCACEGLTFESTDLHEFAYAAFATFLSVAGVSATPHHVISQDEGQLEKAEEAQGNQLMLLMIQMKKTKKASKKGAITAIGEMAAHSGAAFVPFLGDAMTVLLKAADNWHPLIKVECADAMASLIVPCVAQDHGGEIKWEKGDIAGASPLSANTTQAVNVIMKALVVLMQDDTKEVVGKACESIQSIIELCGPHSFASVANECLENTYALLAKEAPCQQLEDYGEEFGDEDDDHDAFMTSVCDLVGSFGRVMGHHFVQYLPKFLPPICEYAKSSRPPSDRSMAVGCLGELAQELGAGISEYWSNVFYPAAIAGLADSDYSVRRNAAFCIGVSCEGLGESVASQYGTMLQAMSPLFGIDVNDGDTAAACVDNASAAVARMITTSPSSVPLAQVLPVVLKALPLKNDMTENETVYNCLFGLLEKNQPDLIANKLELSRVFAEAASEASNVDDDLKEKLKLALQSLH
ncbi:importin [Skeletonema marinoi]|uniref:Importin n=1 Tax=Skeletonema marinoi TaxID=267567 RepID=A0AAD8XZI5_9STRA|nr:importin [Skeletonema marinoi]